MPLSVLLCFALIGQTPTYLDPSRTPQDRAADIVSKMTLEEKVAQMQNSAPAIRRLGVPAYDWWSEALHGPIGSPVTVFPQAIGLSATFDLPMMHSVGTAISDEGRARYYIARDRGRNGMHEGLTFWAPNINIFRDPRWGRGQETYGEDPFLTSQMALNYVSAMQDEHDGHLKAVSTPKHFAVHSGPDPERHGFDAKVDPRDMWNTYLPAFRTAVTQAGAWSVMSAYSSVNGTPDSANPLLLQTILRDKWGFRGYVVSDCDAISDIYNWHHMVNTPAEAAAVAVKAGCDLDCGDTYRYLTQAVSKGLIDEATIDKSVRRLFEARIRLGMFDPPAADPYRRLSKKDIDSSAHRALALRAARESVVMLKNDGILPLKRIRTLAVIGPNADDRVVPLGNYNGSPSKLVTVLDGIRQAAPADVRVIYDRGSTLLGTAPRDVIPETALPGGVVGQYFANKDLAGPPVLTKTSKTLDFNWDQNAPGPGVPRENFSARFTATLVPSASGDYDIGTVADDGSRLWIDGKQVVDDWNEHAPRDKTEKIHLEAGRSYSIKFEYFQALQGAQASLVWTRPFVEGYDQAVSISQKSDAVVLVLGISGAVENEELDRQSIDLPTVQQNLLKAVLATGKPVVVVLESGSCLAVDSPRIGGLIQAWYPGEEGGTAVAEAIFGKLNPSGRLPVTFYRSLSQVPPFRDYKMDRRTYRYLHADQEPLYPFGYGLSFAHFAYSRPAVLTKTNRGSIPTALEVTVKNTSGVDGEEVVQAYASRSGAEWPEPFRKLIGFSRVHLRHGESKRVRIVVPAGAMETADGDGNLAIVPGNYTVSLGGGQPGFEPATSGKAVSVRMKLP
jgi:beta-glucosidase